MMNSSLYLSQSYQDAWDDFQRSLSGSVPAWNDVILTASNEHQAEAFRLQIRSRSAFLPKKTLFTVIPDEGGVRVGSGGFLQAVPRAGVSKEELQSRLKSVFSDTDIAVWDCELI